MSRDDPQVKLRLPTDLKEKIESSARDSKRSMNAEIVARLEASFKSEAYNKDETSYYIVEKNIDSQEKIGIRITKDDLAKAFQLVLDKTLEHSAFRSDENLKSYKNSKTINVEVRKKHTCINPSTGEQETIADETSTFQLEKDGEK